MSLQSDIDDAIEVRKMVRAAIGCFNKRLNHSYDEAEVNFRYRTLKNMLVIGLNDIDGMIKTWRDDIQPPEPSPTLLIREDCDKPVEASCQWQVIPTGGYTRIGCRHPQNDKEVRTGDWYLHCSLDICPLAECEVAR